MYRYLYSIINKRGNYGIFYVLSLRANNSGYYYLSTFYLDLFLYISSLKTNILNKGCRNFILVTLIIVDTSNNC